MQRPYLGAATLFAILVAGPAVAGRPVAIIEEVAVSRGGLDLDDPAGARAMLLRIERAARAACGGHGRAFSSYGHEHARRREYRRCTIAAIDTTIHRLDAPLVRTAWLEQPESADALAARQVSAELLRAAGMTVPPELARE